MLILCHEIMISPVLQWGYSAVLRFRLNCKCKVCSWDNRNIHEHRNHSLARCTPAGIRICRFPPHSCQLNNEGRNYRLLEIKYFILFYFKTYIKITDRHPPASLVMNFSLINQLPKMHNDETFEFKVTNEHKKKIRILFY